jgi:hypothetical protein
MTLPVPAALLNGAQLRESLPDIPLPPWMLTGYMGEGGTFGPFNYDLAIQSDALLEKIQQGVLSKFPTYTYTPTTLPYIGADRGITQGPNEPNNVFQVRLLSWIPVWHVAGSAWAVFWQLQAWLYPFTPAMTLVKNNFHFLTNANTYIDVSIWDWWAAGQAPTSAPYHYANTANNWNWDNPTVWGDADPHPLAHDPWWRAWLILYSTGSDVFCNPAPTIGTAGLTIGNPAMSIGFLDKPATFWGALRSLIRPFKGANTWYRQIIVSFAANLFPPDGAVGANVLPDGSFYWPATIVNGVYVPGRLADARYIDGTL